MLSNRYVYGLESKSVYPDTTERLEGIARLLRKIESGQYQLKDVPCPCGASEDEVLAERDRFTIPMTTVICRNCGIVRINPILDEASCNRFYDEEFRDIATLKGAASGGGKGKRVRLIHQNEQNSAVAIYNFIANTPGVTGFTNGNPKACIADIGAGSGGMVWYFAKKGHPAVGCDYDSEFVAYGKSQGLDLEVGSSEALVSKAPFDVVILSHVFEHVAAPFSMLDSLIRIMRPGSILYIELPSILDISMKRYHSDFLRYLRFVHTFCYSLTTLTNVVESYGFKLLQGDEWIHAAFLYEGTEPQAMKPLRDEYENIMRSLKRREQLRLLYLAYFVYEQIATRKRWRQNIVGLFEAIGLKESLKRLLIKQENL